MTTTPAVALPGWLQARRETANAEVLARLTSARPVLRDVAAAGDVVPGFDKGLILTSGAPLSWSDYTGGQWRAVVSAARYEGLADSEDDLVAKLRGGEVRVRSTQEYACIGSVAGIYTASMPVLVVDDRVHGNTAYCNLYEGESRYRLNYGSYGEEVRTGLRWLERTMAPVLSEALAITGPIELTPLMARAVRMGDELHSRNTAGTLLLERALAPALFRLAKQERWEQPVGETLDFLHANDYTFLRVSMAAAKATADAAHGVPYSSIVTAMALNCREFAIRVSGLPDGDWVRGPFPTLEGKFFDGFTAEDAEWIGGESCVTETVGLGAFVQACAPTLMAYQGGTYDRMCQHNRAMYDITVGEHPEYRIPPFDFRGAPVGIDVFKVAATGITPVIDGGLAGKDGGQVGAGLLHTQPEVFTLSVERYLDRYRSAHESDHEEDRDV